MIRWIKRSILALAADPRYGTQDAVYREISRLSGLSKSAVTKVYSGEAHNPTASTIDNMTAAIKQMFRGIAA